MLYIKNSVRQGVPMAICRREARGQRAIPSTSHLDGPNSSYQKVPARHITEHLQCDQLACLDLRLQRLRACMPMCARTHISTQGMVCTTSEVLLIVLALLIKSLILHASCKTQVRLCPAQRLWPRRISHRHSGCQLPRRTLRKSISSGRFHVM